MKRCRKEMRKRRNTNKTHRDVLKERGSREVCDIQSHTIQGEEGEEMGEHEEGE